MVTETKVRRDDPKSLQLQLTEIIRGRIKDGMYPPRTKLPSEREICDEFGVSRITVREMIRNLKEENLVKVQAGRGAFVLCPKRDIAVKVSLEGFTSDLKKAGKVPGSKLLRMGVVELPDEEVVEAMRLTPADKVIRIERIRTVDGIPLAIHTSWLNLRFCDQIFDYNLAELSLLTILREEFRLKIKNATQSVFASLADERERELLSLLNPSSVMRETRTTFLESGEVIEYSTGTYCGEHYHLLIKLDLDAEATQGN